MRKMTRELAGRTATTDFQAQRRTIVKPVIVSEKNGIYKTADGREFFKDVFDRLFPPAPKRKISKKVPKENADKTKDWMK